MSVHGLVHDLKDGVDDDDLVENEEGFRLRRIGERRLDKA